MESRKMPANMALIFMGDWGLINENRQKLHFLKNIV
jgi:hypothetical protein